MSIQKVSISGESLPLITSDGKYFVRYRIVSNDDGLTSPWSTFYEFAGNTISDFIGEAADTLYAVVNSDSKSILLQWGAIGSDTTKSAKFDVFAKWAYDEMPTYLTDYEYLATVSSTAFSIQIPVNATYGTFAVQLATQDKAITATTIETLGLGEKEISTTFVAVSVTAIDGGTI